MCVYVSVYIRADVYVQVCVYMHVDTVSAILYFVATCKWPYGHLLPPAKRMVLLSVASVNLCVSLCVCPVRALTSVSYTHLTLPTIYSV